MEKVPRYEKPCENCGSFDWKVVGQYSECRPCKRYNSALRRINMGKGRKIRYVDEEMPWHVKRNKRPDSCVGKMHREKTECKWGHPFDEENTLWVKQGPYKTRNQRRCRACNRNRNRARLGLDPLPADVPRKSLSDMLLDDDE